jgi:CRP/FNR family transcriptional regulator
MSLEHHHSTPGQSAPVSCSNADGAPSNCAGCGVKRFAVCSAMADHEIGEIEAIVHTIRLDPREPVFQEGDKADFIFTVTSGTIRLQRDLEDGRRQIIGFAVPGDFIGLALEDRFSFSADAITRATVCAFDRGKFTRLVEGKPALLRRLHDMASHELGIAQEHMVLLGRRRAEERVAAFLLSWQTRVGRVQGGSVTIPLPMGRQDIADFLGLTIETVSRILARWMRERVLLDVPNGVRVLDLARLKGVVG